MKKVSYTKVFTIASIICICLFAFSLMMGTYQMSIQDVIQTFLGQGDRLQEFTIYQSRLPRIVLAIIVASALAVSGTLLQAVTRNSLAEPGMIGMNAGAALFVVIFISLKTNAYYSTLSMSNVVVMPFVAMIGSIVALLLIYAFAYRKGILPIRFILCGIGVNAGINAIITYYQLSMSKGDFHQVLTWTNGSLWGSSWQYIQVSAPFVVFLCLYAFSKSRVLDIFGIGNELASGVGVSIKKEMFICLVIATLLAACATAVAGNIAFLALLGPQLAKHFTGNQHRLLFPLGILISICILLFSDVIARTLFSPIEIPVGIIVSLIGVPYFLYLMLKGR